MAKPFYSIEEVCERLNRSPDEVKALVRDGRLREFRDAGRIFFRSEDVEKLSGAAAPAPAKGDSGEIMLEPIGDDELPSFSDAGTSGGTSVLGLQPLDDEPSPPPPPRAPAASARAKEDTAITSAGIGVYSDDEVEVDADPMAKTQISPAAGVGDQLALEGSGSGSGLLDLTRESDDTSLGAELLDEIYPGEEEQQAAPPPPRRETPRQRAAAAAPVETVVETQVETYVAPSYVVASDPSEGLFAGLMVGSLLLIALAGSVAAGALQGFLPSYARWLSDNFFIFLGAAALVPIVTLLIGWVVGRAGTPRRG